MKNLSELNPHGYATNPVIDKNLQVLFERLIEVQDVCDKDFVITSGLRSEELQAELIKAGKTHASHSKHLAGAAADVLDVDGSLTEWVKANLKAMERIGLWMESFDSIKVSAEKHHTDIWVHFQIMAPLSGNRVFVP